MLTLKCCGQLIDVSGASQKVFDKKTYKWSTAKIDFEKCSMKKIFDLIVPVIPLKQLVAYKKKLGRPTDFEDVNFLLR
ncbi:hypothetical protein AUJ65_02830 [Candidatus Micrarchaeota archaeon CG1_02_51_15]|nr:MAG: hypothetical protein AUJ65_02830 [Candidatus Micrarchaeota archaeon CG1_02_51_15]